MGLCEISAFNVQRLSTEDGPGIRTTVFFKGCPMRCPWCHNPESIEFRPEVVWHAGRCLNDRGCIEVCPERALSPGGNEEILIDRRRCKGCGCCATFCPSAALEMHGRTTPVKDLFALLMRDAAFYETSGGGVTLSGGEPLAQPGAALELLRLLDDAGVHAALDTCGAVSEAALGAALEVVDLVLFDVKTVDPAKHNAFTGVPFERVAAAAALIEGSGVPVWVRTPVIPGYTDDEASIRAVARYVVETFSHCDRHELLAFSNLCTSKYAQLGRPFALGTASLLDADAMDRLCAAAREEGSTGTCWSGPTRVKEGVA